VGCGDATERMKDDQKVTVSCAEGDTGYVYADILVAVDINKTVIGDGKN
jgi:phosphoenolpyruvate synthase/pyruvate phosphate dikinase